MWSPDSMDPVSQVGGGTSAGVGSTTAAAPLASLWAQGWNQAPQRRARQQTALHTGGRLDVGRKSKYV